VLAKPEGHKTHDKKDISKMFEKIHGVELKLRRYDGKGLAELEARWPHAVGVIRRIAGDLDRAKPVRLKPTLLVGRPGTGKTSLLLAIAERFKMPNIVYPCGSSGDNTFGGTPSRWASAGASVPLELIRQSELANPLIILDEVEKCGMSRAGSLVAALLPFLEKHTSERYHESCVDQPADLSMVNYLATANSLEGLPAPLRDRFRIIEMPAPGPQHIGVLAKAIVAEIATARGQTGLMPELAPDELEVVGRAWSSGSIRALGGAVEIAVDHREQWTTRQ
jgi:ATP-dependent Lon protease